MGFGVQIPDNPSSGIDSFASKLHHFPKVPATEFQLPTATAGLVILFTAFSSQFSHLIPSTPPSVLSAPYKLLTLKSLSQGNPDGGVKSWRQGNSLAIRPIKAYSYNEPHA